MSPCDLLTAVVLLSAVPGTPEPEPAAAHWPALREAVQTIALEWEILDPRERAYLPNVPNGFAADLDQLRCRKQDLEGAPPLSDANRWPAAAVATERLTQIRQYHARLAQRGVWENDRLDLIRPLLAEARWREHVWDAVRNAREETGWYVVTRRQALATLLGLLGADAYAAGELPDGVPGEL